MSEDGPGKARPANLLESFLEPEKWTSNEDEDTGYLFATGLFASEEAKAWSRIAYETELIAHFFLELIDIDKSLFSRERVPELVFKGLAAEVRAQLQKSLREQKRPRGRPPKKNRDLGSIDEQRAYALWLLVHSIGRGAKNDYDPAKGIYATVSNLIVFARYMSAEAPDVYRFLEPLFPATTTEQDTLVQSVSRGRRKLKIDRLWRSEVCDALSSE